MAILKLAAGACVLLVAAVDAGSNRSTPVPPPAPAPVLAHAPADPPVPLAGNHAPAVDMSRFQQAFN